MSDPIDAPAPPRLDDLLCFLVYSTGFAFNRVYRRPLDQLGLTYPQYLVMQVLWADDAQNVGQISDRMRLDSSTLTPLLKRLESLGLVSRERSAADERRVVVRLTDLGRDLRRKAGDVEACLREAVGMGQEDVTSLAQQLRSLRDSLERAAA